MARSIPAERLTEGATIQVSGIINYSHVTKVIEGEALTKRYTQAKARGALYPMDVPHTTITIADPVVTATGPNGTFTVEEQFVHEGIYIGKTGELAGRAGYGIDSRGEQLPLVMELQADGSFSQVQPTGELVKGLQVTLVINVFKPRNYEKRGLGLQAVLVKEPIRTYGRGGTSAVAAALAAIGVAVSGELTTPAPTQGGGLPTSFEEAQAAAAALPLPGVFDPQAPLPAATPAPVAPVPSADEHIAALTAQLAAAQAAQQAQASASAGSPWDVPSF